VKGQSHKVALLRQEVCHNNANKGLQTSDLVDVWSVWSAD